MNTNLLSYHEIDELMGRNLRLINTTTGVVQPCHVKKIGEKSISVRNGTLQKDQIIYLSNLSPFGLPEWKLELPDSYTGIDYSTEPKTKEKKSKEPKTYQVNVEAQSPTTPQAKVVFDAIVDYCKENELSEITMAEVKELMETLKKQRVLITRQDPMLIFQYYVTKIFRPSKMIW